MTGYYNNAPGQERGRQERPRCQEDQVEGRPQEPVAFDLTLVDEFWSGALDVEAILRAVAARLTGYAAVVERRQLERLSAQEVAILVERERTSSTSVRHADPEVLSHRSAVVGA